MPSEANLVENSLSLLVGNTVNKPLAITMGDPAGVGPEVLAKMLAVEESLDQTLVLIGSRWALNKGAEAAGVALPPITDISHPRDASGIALVDLQPDVPTNFRFGEVDAGCGDLAVRSVEQAAHWCLDGSVAGMVTCPINKEAIHAAGYVDDIGHQEILSRITGAGWTATMLMTTGLKVIHLSTHKSLIQAAQYVTRANVVEKLKLTDATLKTWGLAKPRIALAALNPHGGEGGLLGREEIDELVPAVSDVRAKGLDVTGPLPADSVFNRAIDGEFDAVMALYHDQGHIAIKVHDFHASTTATMGIPFVRTSVDHGTAFDIAGSGQADERGLIAAVDAANALISGELARL
jgi:4-hydroxythreonine-4-phosphate dehydrogenase